MSGLWQNIAAWYIVFGAIAYVARRAWRRATSQKPPGCPTCSACRQRPHKVRFVRYRKDSAN